jgi:hypothetical protein
VKKEIFQFKKEEEGELWRGEGGVGSAVSGVGQCGEEIFSGCREEKTNRERYVITWGDSSVDSSSSTSVGDV